MIPFGTYNRNQRLISQDQLYSFQVFDLFLNIESENLAQKVNKLIPRQLEIIGLLAQGHGNKQVAYLLSIGVTTVKRHIYNACNRVDVENKTQLIVMYTMWKVANELTVSVTVVQPEAES